MRRKSELPEPTVVLARALSLSFQLCVCVGGAFVVCASVTCVAKNGSVLQTTTN